MKKQFLLILLPIVLLSCNNTNEDKIKEGFNSYVNKNFDNPDKIESIVDITCIDTLSWKNLAKCSRLVINDFYLIDSLNSIVNNIFKNEVYKDLASLSQKKRNTTFADFIEYYDFCDGYNRFCLNKVIPFHENTITDMEKLIKLKDNSNINYLLYKIKYRIKRDNNTKYLKTCYCYVDNNSYLEFRNTEILEEMPITDKNFRSLYKYTREGISFEKQYRAMVYLKQEKLDKLRSSIFLVK